MKSRKNQESYLERAVADIDSPFITESMFRNIFRCIKGSDEAARKIYSELEKQYSQYLLENKMINPGVDGVPNGLATNYLNKISVNRKTLSRALEAERKKSRVRAGKTDDVG